MVWLITAKCEELDEHYASVCVDVDQFIEKLRDHISSKIKDNSYTIKFEVFMYDEFTGIVMVYETIGKETVYSYQMKMKVHPFDNSQVFEF